MNKKCQVFTPKNNVMELLDTVGYIKDLYGYKVIENACGDGNILVAIVERYIKDCLLRGFDIDLIRNGLETDIYGAEIDKEHYSECIHNLDLVAEKYELHRIKWNIMNVDILKTKLEITFDYVIGNPPYIKYRDLDEDTRVYVKENYNVCSQGKFDYCYAFIEFSINSLNDNGKLAYLIPSNIFKNVFGKRLREFMLPVLSKIYDYTTEKLFDVALTSSAIIIIDKKFKNEYIEYFDIAKSISFKIDKDKLSDKWIFSEKTEKKETNKTRFGDYFIASISIATLLNEAFVIKKYSDCGEYVIVNGYKIEKDILRNAYSPRSLNYNKKELIIYPYYYKNEILIRYSEDEFRNYFPETVKYLETYSEKLSERKSDNNTKWYEYGRTQALAHLNQKKLLTSTVVTKQVKVYNLSKDSIPYSGIYIICKNGASLDKAKSILESNSFYEYIQKIGINASGTSLRITAADINNYEFSDQEE